jgi:hypothetical protein
LPSQPNPGAHGPRFVHRRLNIDADFPFGLRLLLAIHESSDEFFFDYVVVIVAPRIPGETFPVAGFC